MSAGNREPAGRSSEARAAASNSSEFSAASKETAVTPAPWTRAAPQPHPTPELLWPQPSTAPARAGQHQHPFASSCSSRYERKFICAAEGSRVGPPAPGRSRSCPMSTCPISTNAARQRVLSAHPSAPGVARGQLFAGLHAVLHPRQGRGAQRLAGRARCLLCLLILVLALRRHYARPPRQGPTATV